MSILKLYTYLPLSLWLVCARFVHADVFIIGCFILEFTEM